MFLNIDQCIGIGEGKRSTDFRGQIFGIRGKTQDLS